MNSLPDNSTFGGVRPEQAAWVDFLRSFAVLAVVGLHAAVPVVLGFGRISQIDWWCGNIFDSSVRWCVPVFVMITGALLLNPKRHAGFLEFYRKKITRMLVLLIFWSVIYSALTCFIDLRAHQQIDFKLIIINFIAGRPYPHLWYLFMLIGLYAVTPVLRSFLGILNGVQTVVLMIILVAVGILFALFSQTNYETGNLFFLWSLQFLGYFVLGGVAFKKRLWEKINMPVLVCFYCISVAVTSMGCGWLSNTASLTEGLMFYNYTNPSVVVMAVAVFLLAAKMEHLLSKINFSRAIVKTTLGIYLIHPLVLFVLFRFNVGRDFPSLLAIIINCIISYFLSLAATLLFQRIPLLKMTV